VAPTSREANQLFKSGGLYANEKGQGAGAFDQTAITSERPDRNAGRLDSAGADPRG
jgi:hypothetical protein